MKHRNPERMRANARATLSIRYPRSVNQIFRAQDKPRLPRAEIAQLVCELVAAGEVEEIEIGFKKYYRLKELALARAPAYNSDQRNEFSLGPEADWFLHTLSPLQQGKTVYLSLDDPRFGSIKNYRGTKRKQLVILVPGPAISLRQGVLLVCVIGAGSCLIRPKTDGQKIANLVLAGMPARLATTLMNKLHLIY